MPYAPIFQMVTLFLKFLLKKRKLPFLFKPCNSYEEGLKLVFFGPGIS